LVEAVVTKLRNVGALENTYVVFTSETGWHHGEHRIRMGKRTPYEESIRMPLLIRGPGVQAGTTTDLKGSVTTPWRSAVLREHRDEQYPSASFYAVRTSDGRKYIEYEGGFKELYDLNPDADPYELNNFYSANSPPAELATRLQALKGCGASSKGGGSAKEGPRG
jgi:N-acetylglucosamine-6-sulfatase